MEKMEKVRFESNSFGKRMKSMLKVDFRRMFTMPLFYIMVGICLVMPMLTPLDSSVMNVVLCLAGGLLLSVGLGAISNLILKRTSLV